MGIIEVYSTLEHMDSQDSKGDERQTFSSKEYSFQIMAIHYTNGHGYMEGHIYTQKK